MATADELKGRAKQAVGDMTDNDDLKQAGAVDKAKANVKDAVDTVAGKATEVADRVTD